jgi:hypothetical protein
VKRYTRAELVAFLRRVDALLTTPERLDVVGGAAAILRYGVDIPTKDIDTWNNVSKTLMRAVEIVDEMGKGVPLGPAGIAEIPNEAEDRFVIVPIGLKHLIVRVPNRYDLALSKTIRGYENDLQVIKAMHEVRPFKLDTLIKRFETEMEGTTLDGKLMSMVTKDPRSMRFNVVLLVERLFGYAEGSKLSTKWGLDKSG